MKLRAKSLFISHGGGPLPLLNDAGHQELVQALREIGQSIEKPDAVVLVSAHWEAPLATITSAPKPSLIYDYYGFPDEAYHIAYDCHGLPPLANTIQTLLEQAGIDSRLDHTRGFDHGMFVPMKLLFPDADVPCVQVSLEASLDPARHINIGKSLRSLSEQNILLIGSGFSFHNMKAFFADDQSASRQRNEQFESWLVATCTQEFKTEHEREDALIHWTNAPDARYCHPREEHLIPLHVCYGLAQSPCIKHYEVNILNKKASMYMW